MAYRIQTSLHPMHNPRFRWLETPDGFKPIDWLRGFRADPATVPTQAREYSNFKRFPDVFPTLGVWTVSEDFRRIAEELEPGVNQYFPIELFRRSGGPIKKQYYILNVCQSFDAIDTERSNITWYVNEYGGGFYTQGKGGYSVVMFRDQIGGSHFWSGNEHFFNHNYASDEFVRRLKAAKINGWRASKIEEV
ncbi:MAG: DUF1629 domain-containing protein [Pseudomonadota bacterium]